MPSLTNKKHQRRTLLEWNMSSRQHSCAAPLTQISVPSALTAAQKSLRQGVLTALPWWLSQTQIPAALARNSPYESGVSKIKASGFPAVEIRTRIYIEPLFLVVLKFTSTWQETWYALQPAALELLPQQPWDFPSARHIFIIQKLVRRTKWRLSIFWFHTWWEDFFQFCRPRAHRGPRPFQEILWTCDWMLG